MKKLPWIIMRLLFLSGVGMIAWSLFPMPVKLISGKLTGDKPEKTVAESDAITSNVLSDSNTIEISEDGFTVIEPETTEESSGKEEKLSEAAVFVPRTDPDQVENTGSYTLPEKAEMKDGSIGVLTIGSQAADTSIGGQAGKRHLQAEIVSCELINRRGTSHTDFLGLRAEEKLVEVFRDGCCNFFDLLLR